MAEDAILFFFSRDEMQFKTDESALREAANKMMTEIGYDDLLGDAGTGETTAPSLRMVAFDTSSGMDFGTSDLSEGTDFFLG